MVSQGRQDPIPIGRIERPCERHVEMEILENIGIAESEELFVLPGRKAALAPSFDIFIGKRRPKRLERADAVRSQPIHLGAGSGQGEGDPAREFFDDKRRCDETLSSLGEGLRGVTELIRGFAVSENEGCFQGGVKAVMAR